jgi:uncharacterized cupredoxin-like copper-binding protein
MRKLLLIASLFAVAAVGCGGTDGSDDGGPIRIEASDFEFDHNNIRVGSQADVVVEVRNTGSIEHTWTVLAPETRVSTADGVDPQRILISVEVGAAQLETVTFTPPRAGKYQIICLIPGHLEAGMEATLEVTS